MRIVCWNMQKVKMHRLGNPKKVLSNMDKYFNADIIIILEAPESLVAASSGNSGAGRYGSGYQFQTIYSESQFRHDKILIGSKMDAACESFEVGSSTVTYGVIDISSGSDLVRVVTAHAPFESNQGAAVSFANDVFNDIKKMDVKPQIVIGDFNLYGIGEHKGATANGMSLALRSATSNRGQGSPLDKIWIADGVEYECGRILHESPGHQYKAQDERDKTDPRVKDLTFSWDMIDVPDHIPIYSDMKAIANPEPMENGDAAEDGHHPQFFDPNTSQVRIRELKLTRRRNGGILGDSSRRELERLEQRMSEFKRQGKVEPIEMRKDRGKAIREQKRAEKLGKKRELIDDGAQVGMDTSGDGFDTDQGGGGGGDDGAGAAPMQTD